MPKAFPVEFRRDVVAVARKGEAPLSSDREGLRDLRVVPAPLAQDRPTSRTASVPVSPAADESAELRELTEAQPAAGAGERGPAPCVGVSVARDVQPKMMYPLVLDLAADAVPVTVTCRVLGFSTQAFYKWRKATRVSNATGTMRT